MQLSAPKLPFDPNAQISSDGSGFPSFSGRGDASASGPTDFGAMLSAESGDETADRSSTNSDESHQRASRVVSAGSTAQEPTLESLAAADGLVVPQTPAEPEPDPVNAEMDFTLTGVRTGDADTANTSTATEAISAPPNHGVNGSRMAGNILSGKYGASLRAYALSTEGRATRSAASPQTAPAGETSPGASTSALGGVPLGNANASSSASAGENPTAALPSLANVSSDATAPRPEEGASSVEPFSSASRTATSAAGGEAERSRVDLPSTPNRAGEQAFNVSSTPVEPTDPDLATVEPALVESQTLDAELAPSQTPPDRTAAGSDRDRFTATAGIAEKIAAQLFRNDQRISASEKAPQIVSLTAGIQNVEDSAGSIGINAAKLGNFMPATASIPTPASVAIENASLNVAPLSFDALVQKENEGSAGQVAVARRAVESVLTAADQLATGEQRSVRLQFTVGGEELAVRVELRGDKIHTTFRTDSSELRSALAHEWQSVSAVQNGVRTQRLADPVFASNSSGNGQNFSSDSGLAQHRDSGHRHSDTSSDEIHGARRAFSNTAAVPVAVAAAPATATQVLNPLRLHTFA